MTVVDRLSGINGSLGVKAPAKAATTANITLSGEQTIDTIACVDGDRVLVKNQTTGADNGVYTVSTGVWTRALDFDGSRDIVSGTSVFVTNGSANPSTFYYISTANPITIGTTSLTFASAASASLDPTLVALAGLDATAGLVEQTGADTFTKRALGVVASTSVPTRADADGRYQPLDADLTAIAANATDGFLAHTGAGTAAARTLQAPAAGLTISNPAGVAGDPAFALANDLAALEALATTGIARRTGASTWTAGTAVTNAELDTMAAYTIKINNTNGTATPTDVDIASLSTKGSPAGGDYLMLSDQAASGAFKKVRVDAVGSGGAVSSVNGQSGSVVAYFPPQGRLTLVSATPVMTTTQSAKTTIYYTPYVGNMVPIYDGTNMLPTACAEISVATSDTTKNPAAIGASKVNDWFVWNDAGTMRISHGPDWTSDSARSVGTALVLVNGIYLNNASITNGPAASRGTYVGTTRSNASSQLDWFYGAGASGGTSALLNVWNMYNRVNVCTTTIDTGSSHAYTTATIRQWNATVGFQITATVGLSEDCALLSAQAQAGLVGASATAVIGIGVNSTTTMAQRSYVSGASGLFQVLVVSTSTIPQLGVNTYTINEIGDATNANTFGGGGTQNWNGLTASLRM